MKKVFLNIRRMLTVNRLVWKGYLRSLKQKELPMDEPIDFVVTWVDGNDPVWQAEKAKYDPAYQKGNTDARYREWNQFMYWFRAVEKYAPWVRYVYLVTWGHLPAWLNTNHPKLKIVNHCEFIPREYLPTFNCNSIELNLHRIPGLSENFIYFNDDFYLGCPVKPTDFFQDGKPKHAAIAIPIRNYRYNGPFAHMHLSDLGLINSIFDVQSSMIRNPELWFAKKYGKARIYNINAFQDAYLPGIYITHLGYPSRKSTLENAWKMCEKEFDETSSHRFRTPLDYIYHIFTLWDIMSGNFIPVPCEYYGVKFGSLSTQLDDVSRAFAEKKHRMICLNDSVDVTEENYPQIKTELDRILQNTFPEKSSFEK